MLMRLVPEHPDKPGSFAGVPRGEHRRPRWNQWVGLWPRVRFPEVQRGVYVWQDGRTLLVESHDDYALYHDADLIILGGTVYTVDDADWPYAVLTAAGYTFEPA